MQRALLQFSIHDNYDLVKEALIKAHREDLIGNGPDCLIPYNKPYKNLIKIMLRIIITIIIKIIIIIRIRILVKIKTLFLSTKRK